MRFGGERVQIVSDSSPRVLASQPSLLSVIERDFHWLSQMNEWFCVED